MDIPLLAGRAFRHTDDDEGPPVAVVDQNLAERYWPGGDPIGKQLRLSGRPGNVARWRTVVGVVGSVKALGLEATAREHVYTPYPQAAFPFFAVARRDRGRSVAAGRRRAQHGLVDRPRPADRGARADEAIVDESIAGQRSFAWLMGAFGLVALLLVAVGVYGVVAYSVTQRAGEIGIRMALGAERGSIVRMVVGQSVGVAAAGVALGAWPPCSSSRLRPACSSGQLPRPADLRRGDPLAPRPGPAGRVSADPPGAPRGPGLGPASGVGRREEDRQTVARGAEPPGEAAGQEEATAGRQPAAAHSKRREAPRATPAAIRRVERVHPEAPRGTCPSPSPRSASGSWTAWSPAAPGTTWRRRSA